MKKRARIFQHICKITISSIPHTYAQKEGREREIGQGQSVLEPHLFSTAAIASLAHNNFGWVKLANATLQAFLDLETDNFSDGRNQKRSFTFHQKGPKENAPPPL